jgi:phosphatidylglycerophosphate synthase
MPYKRLKIIKGYIDIALRPPMMLLRRLGVHPTHITLLSLPCGLLGVWFLYERPQLSGLLVLAYIALDVLDGTMARVTGTVTKLGTTLDFMFDRLVAGMFLVVYHLHSGDILLPATGLTGIVLFSLEDAGLIRR